MKEEDIRPAALARKYYELSARDAELCFTDKDRDDVPCVACGSTESRFSFEKNGFAYAQCESCKTLFQSPRPRIDAFEAFYRNSESSEYWANVFFPAVAEVRREKIFRPRVERLLRMCRDAGATPSTVVDVGAGFGIFLDEWRQFSPAARLIAVEPSRSLAAECRTKGFDVVEEIAENASGLEDIADLVVCFEVLEHVYEPVEFLKTLAKFARPGGLVFISTLGVDGFDIQVLWERSNAIFPPHHINFLSVDGFERLFERAGLTDVAVTTPGELDVDIVRNALGGEPALGLPSRLLAVLSDDRVAPAFQKFLADNRRSSHTWVIGRRPEASDG